MTHTDGALRHRMPCVAALGVTAAIHAAAVPGHVNEWPAAGVFFAVLALAEVALAAAVAVRPSRPTMAAGATVSVASAALWAMSRTVGLPVGPQPFAPEAVATPDVVATALEGVAAYLCTRLAAMPRPVPATTT
ncbi:MAG TPA: hypothetical protein VFJ61_04620 [Solirubrobacterales bacterium]|nr:hypothetical protein [Solirubrobacterales bacterium]